MVRQIGDLLPPVEGESLIEDSGFESFYKNYPRKTDKKAAKRAWDKLSEKDRLAACAGALYHAEHNPQWQDKTLIPHPSTFLNGRRWEDEVVAPQREEVINDVSDLGRMVWSACTQLYGQTWINKHGAKPSPVWQRQLAKLNENAIKRALRNLMEEGETQPPSLPHFAKLCRGEELEEFKLLPRPEQTPEIHESGFAELRSILKY